MAETLEAGSVPEASHLGQGRFAFLGGDPSIDFVNTVDSWLGDAPIDRLATYDDLLEWIEQAGLAGREVIAPLRQTASKCPEDAERALRKTRSFRASLYQILADVISGLPPGAKDLAAVTSLARKAATHSHLAHDEDGFAWILDSESVPGLDWPAWKIARAAISLLTSESLKHVRRCADETCGWLFIDRSRNHSRRWCDMRDCGNRAKAQRNYARRRARRLATDD